MARSHSWVWGAAVLVGCASPAFDDGVSVGDASGDAVIGVVTSGERGLAYVCGGPDTLESHTRWFELVPTTAGFEGEADDWLLTGTVESDGWTGELEDPDGDVSSWSAAGVDGDLDGVYDADEGDCRAGAVVLDGGSRMQGAFCAPQAQRAQVVPVGQIVLEGGGIRVQALADPPVEFVVTPALP